MMNKNQTSNETLPTHIAVLGSTGSVGQQALDVARLHRIKVDFLSANTDVASAEAQAREFAPSFVAMGDEAAARDLAVRLADTPVRVLSGEAGICEGISLSKCTAVVNAILGAAGLRPTLAVIDSKKRLALSNKESLVMAGKIVMERVGKTGTELIPVDSEHSAIFQCLHCGRENEVRSLLLTASGGPFFGKTRDELIGITPAMALSHPTWKMGAKITVDSATMMNKGFEVIEACHLFGIGADRINVIVHRESIIHSAVEYIDNTVIACMSLPDMRECVQYALSYPERKSGITGRLDLSSIGKLSFYKPDGDAFPLLPLAQKCARDGGLYGAALNAANEVAVEAFLRERINFTDIFDVVAEAVEATPRVICPTIDDIFECDSEARARAAELITRLGDK